MNYYEKIQKSVDYIELHLKEDLSVCSIAEQAYFSVTHFYRIFRAMVGDSVKEYIRNRRLSQSVNELLTSEKRIIEIAIEYGFESQETYTRAFTKQFGITPGRYRRQGKKIVLYEKADVWKTKQINEILETSFPFRPQIVQCKINQVIGLKAIVKPGSETIRNLWAEFGKRKAEIECQSENEICLGICEYNPDITDESDFTYIASIEVCDPKQIPFGMISRTIPCSKYAVFPHRGSINNLKNTYNYIYGVWLPDSGYELAELDTIEYYDFRSSNSNFEFDIYIPVI
ncbi:AraC family transcriptional regulator [Paenibacillus sp. EZ-K15]|uniref:AraC family transcriptional regulator n=1 Tax=Paenibacillus sp. EZ-K15 TaxID=2044275 RepID=UPI000BF373A7|nr:AraC family transcriptional regulator [Paenibacillus sp. EZ-K15]